MLALGLVVLCSTAAAAPKKETRSLLTFYWIVDESSSKYRGKDDSAVLRDPGGRVIAHVSPQFKRDLVMQGTGWLRDGRTVDYIKRVGDESRFRISKSRFGLAVNGCPLVPYRTVAVDPRIIKIGSKVYIPELKGAELPDGTIHDGMFVATDRGQFRGAHVDVFVGAGARGARPFIRKGHGSRSRVTVEVLGPAGGCRP